MFWIFQIVKSVIQEMQTGSEGEPSPAMFFPRPLPFPSLPLFHLEPEGFPKDISSAPPTPLPSCLQPQAS